MSETTSINSNVEDIRYHSYVTTYKSKSGKVYSYERKYPIKKESMGRPKTYKQMLRRQLPKLNNDQCKEILEKYNLDIDKIYD